MPAPTLQFKRGLFANLPGLKAGEPGFTTDSYELYVGIDSTTQNNKFFGSHRYWTRETTTTGSGVNFVEGTNNGTDFVTIKAPGTLAGIVTFVLPGADGTNGQILTTNGSGTLSFSSPSSSSFTIAGGIGTDTFNTGGTLTFAGTANEIETAVTNDQVQIGLPDNVIITGVITATNGFSGNLTGNVTGNINSSGVSTVTSLVATNINASGIITATSGFVGNLTGTASSTTNIPNLTGDITSVNTVTSIAAGVIVDADINASAGIVDTKLATISTANKVSNSATTATDANTASAIVARDASGNFSAGTITASLTGTASSTTNIPNLTGAITSVGTATTLGSFSSANLSAALTDETGSGSAVFATSPTLVTPVLGAATGTSLNLGNINLESNGNATILGQLELGNASDTTITRVSAGVVAIEGVNVVTTSSTDTLTNKTLTSPILTTPSLGIATATSIVVGSGVTINASGIVASAGIITASSFVGSLTGTASSTTNIPNLTGAITSVNTTTSLGSFSSSNLATALTDKTGTGVAVFATSPTLVTPVLGDATATTIVTSGAVNVGTALSSPTVKTATIQHSNATNAATIDASGNITAAQNLTISGNLYVNGSTTQVNTAAITVEDRTIELGVVDGAAPSSATTWDLGVLFNYHATTAKKSAVIWEHGDARFKFASVLTADTDGSTVDTPQLAVTTFAPVEIGQLWVTDCAGTSQVISCTGTTRNLENITVDCGSF